MKASPALRALIETEGDPGPDGPVLPFERFMEAALYDPAHGYYTRQVRSVGRRGDFSTAPTLSPALGLAVAAWARPLAEGVRDGAGAWHLVEVGGGTGALARTVLEASDEDPPHYHLVERSMPLRAAQETTLDGYPVTWHADMSDALHAVGGRAIVVSNELVDAFPCVVLERHGGQWRALGLGLEDDRVVERWCDHALPAVSWSMAAQPTAEGRRCEVHGSWQRWLVGWMEAFKGGHMLTIDYGDEVDRLYHRRPRGTLRGYFQHLLVSGIEIYERFGHQDLTADVNFTDLRAWGEALGLATHLFTDQRSFVLAQQPDLARSTHPGTQFMLHPDGMGGAFRVLWQGRA